MTRTQLRTRCTVKYYPCNEVICVHHYNENKKGVDKN